MDKFQVPVESEIADTSEFKPIASKIVPWHVKRQMLEAESLKKAREIQARKSLDKDYESSKTDKLESEILEAQVDAK